MVQDILSKTSAYLVSIKKHFLTNLKQLLLPINAAKGAALFIIQGTPLYTKYHLYTKFTSYRKLILLSTLAIQEI